VTVFLTRDARFVSVRVPAPTFISSPGLRLTVDTADDLQFVRHVFETAEQRHPRPVPLVALIAAAERLTGMVPICR
jgi:spore coat polysaccharide biosynthesis protein SpsF (cytidylyltransferase family)